MLGAEVYIDRSLLTFWVQIYSQRKARVKLWNTEYGRFKLGGYFYPTHFQDKETSHIQDIYPGVIDRMMSSFFLQRYDDYNIYVTVLHTYHI